MEFTATTLLMDFAYASILLLVAKIIRVKIPFIQRMYLPTPLLAGLIGMVCGPYLLNIMPFSSAASGYSGLLMTVLAATLFLGKAKNTQSFKQVVNEMSDSLLTNLIAYFSQWGIGLLAGFFLLKAIWPDIHEAFGLLMPAGWCGGHGTAAAIGGVFGEAGWTDATSIATTFATIGMLVGVLGGILMINIGARKGWTAVVKKPSELPEEFRTGLFRGKRENCGEETICSMSMDTFTFHLMLTMVTVFLAYVMADLLKALTTISFPTFSMAMVMSFVVNLICRKSGVNKYVDRGVMEHTGGCLTDYLICFAVSTINLSVVSDMWQPILIMCLIGLATVLFYLLVMCRKHCDQYWFEQGIIIWGWDTGATSTSMLLIRTCDPEYKTGVFQTWVVVWIFVSVVDIFTVSLLPWFTVQGQGIAAGVVLLVVSVVLYGILIMRTRKHKRMRTNAKVG